jgi:prepilin-type N-terminal cleavage/methylation domain-containing protein
MTLRVRRRSPSGFSLIELVFALVLLGILAGMAAPSLYGWVNRSRLEAAVNELNADFAQSRMLAVRSGEGATLRITSATTYQVELPNGVRRTVDLSQDYPRVQISASSFPLVFAFDSRGMMRSVPVSQLETTQDGRSVRLNVLASGRVFVE